jgi:hypothetical protein
MGYGDFGIPHHEITDRGDDPETDFGMIGHGVTGWDMGCLTLEFYVNRRSDIGCLGGSTWRRRGTRKEGVAYWGRESGCRVSVVSGQKKNPVGLNLRGLWWGLLCQLPARAERMRRRVKRRHRAK